METMISSEAIMAANAYEELHVPALFDQWAERVLDAARVLPSDRVLDVACGTGVLARRVAKHTLNPRRVIGLDPGLGMLAVANHLAPDIEWREGVAESLPFKDQSFDVVVSQFGLMFFSDRVAALKEMMRVLVPNGRFAVAVWSSLEDSEAYPELVDLLQRLAGMEAAEALRTPFNLGNTEELKTLFKSAGIVGAEISTRSGTAHFPNIRTMVEADLRGWLPVMGVNLDEHMIDLILNEAEALLSRYVSQSGEVVFSAPAHIVSGKKYVL